MDKLSLKSYGWKCVLGAEVIYFLCLGYGTFISQAGATLHKSLFELLPGFVWGTASGVIIGAIEFFIFAWIFAWYYVWMHNSSMVREAK